MSIADEALTAPLLFPPSPRKRGEGGNAPLSPDPAPRKRGEGGNAPLTPDPSPRRAERSKQGAHFPLASTAAARQSFTVPSSAATAIRRPSDAMANSRGALPWPGNVKRSPSTRRS